MSVATEADDRVSTATATRVPVRLVHGLIIAAIVVLPIALTAPFFSEPFDVDEGAYATVAQGLLDGQVPYRDLFDHKPPMVYGWYALSFLAFGENIEAPRIVASLVLSGVALLVAATGSALFTRRVGYGAGLLFALSCGLAMLRMNANTEVFMLLPLTGALYAGVRGLQGGGPAWWFVAGALVTIAVATKPIAAPHFLVLGAAAMWAGSQTRTRRLVPVLTVGAGAATAAAAVVAPFVLSGAWSDFWWANVSYNAIYSGGVTTATKVRSLLTIGLIGFPLIAAPLVGSAAVGSLALIRRRQAPGDHLLLAWVGAAMVRVAATGRFYPHYFAQLLPALALVASAGVASILAARHPTAGERLVLMVGMAVLFGTSIATNAPAFLAATPGERHMLKVGGDEWRRENKAPAIASYLAEVTEPGEVIYDFGRQSQIYFLADRPPAAVNFYLRPFILHEGAAADTVTQLRGSAPRYIVDTEALEAPVAGAAFTARVGEYYYPPAFAELLRERYEFVEVVEYAAVYRLRAESR